MFWVGVDLLVYGLRRHINEVAGALLSKSIKSLEVIAYEDLGTESMKKLEVDGFPAILCCDMFGGDLLKQGRDQWRQQDKLGSYEPIGTASAGKTDGGGK